MNKIASQPERTVGAETTTALIEAGEGASSKPQLKKTRRGWTVAEVEPGAVGSISPEFIRPSDARKLYGLGRTYLYGLLKSGRIKSCVLRKRGARTGIRLVSTDSIREFIRERMDAEGGEVN